MQQSKTQIGLLGLIEKYVRKFVTIYYFEDLLLSNLIFLKKILKSLKKFIKIKK